MEIKGLDELIKDLNKLGREVPRAEKLFLDRSAAKVRDYTKDNTPVDQGTLKLGWHYKMSGQSERIVYNNVDYAPHIEFGHRTRGGGFYQGQYMLKKGVNYLESTIERDLRKFLQDVIR